MLDDVERLAQRRRLEPEHAVEEVLAVVVLGREAVGGGIELGVVLLAVEAERVEVGDQVPAHAIGADHHDQPDAVTRRRAHHVGSQRGNRQGRRQRGLPAVGAAVPAVVGDCGLARRPGGPADLVQHRAGIVAEAGEKTLPARIDRGRVVQVAAVELLDEDAVGAVQE